MIFASIYPTTYNQPRPTDGDYTAIAFNNHAEFEYLGHKIIANAHKPLNVDKLPCLVTVKSFGGTISLEPATDLDHEPTPHLHTERTALFQSIFSASLTPIDFEQDHPFLGTTREYKTRTNCYKVAFGSPYSNSYYATLDNNQEFPATNAPCIVRPHPENPMKCLIVLDEPAVFMAQRYGKGAYDKLVTSAVRELQHSIYKHES